MMGYLAATFVPAPMSTRPTLTYVALVSIRTCKVLASIPSSIIIDAETNGRMNMAFKNEVVPPLEQETSDFFKKVQEVLHASHTGYTFWTVDRERNMVLRHMGGGHSMEAANEDYWSFITVSREYRIDTKLLAKAEISPDVIAMTRSISYRGVLSHYPEPEIIACIKEALQEYSRRYMFTLEHYKRCQLRLIDATTGKEI